MRWVIERYRTVTWKLLINCFIIIHIYIYIIYVSLISALALGDVWRQSRTLQSCSNCLQINCCAVLLWVADRTGLPESWHGSVLKQFTQFKCIFSPCHPMLGTAGYVTLLSRLETYWRLNMCCSFVIARVPLIDKNRKECVLGTVQTLRTPVVTWVSGSLSWLGWDMHMLCIYI